MIPSTSLFSGGEPGHPIHQLAEVNTLKEEVEIDAVEQTVEVEPLHDRLQVKAADDGVEIDMLQQLVDVDPAGAFAGQRKKVNDDGHDGNQQRKSPAGRAPCGSFLWRSGWRRLADTTLPGNRHHGCP